MEAVKLLATACRGAFHDHYSDREGLSNCPAITGGPCECGADETNDHLTLALAKAKEAGLLK